MHSCWWLGVCITSTLLKHHPIMYCGLSGYQCISDIYKSFLYKVLTISRWTTLPSPLALIVPLSATLGFSLLITTNMATPPTHIDLQFDTLVLHTEVQLKILLSNKLYYCLSLHRRSQLSWLLYNIHCNNRLPQSLSGTHPTCTLTGAIT